MHQTGTLEMTTPNQTALTPKQSCGEPQNQRALVQERLKSGAKNNPMRGTRRVRESLHKLILVERSRTRIGLDREGLQPYNASSLD